MGISPELSELAGLYAADGSMQKDHLRFWGNPIEDKEYYDNRIKFLFKKEFNIEINPHDKPSNSVYGFYVCKKPILESFRKLGFPIGKKTYSVNVPKTIMKSKDPEIWASFLRGFLSGDGCLNFDKRYGNYKKIRKIIHTYPRIQLTNVSKEIIYDMSKLLNRLRISHFITLHKSKKQNEQDFFRIQVSGVQRLEMWQKLIGINNPSKLIKYNIFKKIGFVPPNLNYLESLFLMVGQTCPFSYYPRSTRDLYLKQKSL
jgi:intein/homing endonuclease